jgi:hypothetical protein
VVKEASVRAAMEDATRSDYGMRVGFSNNRYLNLRSSPRIRDLFPDGIKVASVKDAGGLHLHLTNRASGMQGRLSKQANGFDMFELSTNSVEGTKLPNFGAVSPAAVVHVKGGLLVTLPDPLPPVQKRAKRGTAKMAQKKKAAQTTPSPVSTQTATPQVAVVDSKGAAKPPAATPAPASANLTEPTVSLRDAIRAVNTWKLLNPDKVDLSINAETGTLRAYAEYE